ncbi:putative DNA polymerase delta subunit 4 [Amylocarpus encephaloides]|uniref:DNA polymerase delta subunit 4 n=1 Tax=Amylocarpus encephaloides TaxID=45428 RepID=A0A9P8C1J8_9HELO|nr:putative DNA polymerase delta subunit 4 [Amylocarpus encephaloides]
MARTRRATRATSGGPAARGSQKTLAFTHGKVTKPSTPLPGKPVASSKLAMEIDAGDIDSDAARVASEPTAPEHAGLDIPRVSRSAEAEKARRVTDAQVQAYWRAREDDRLAPRVHQGDLRVEEKILRLWDMSSQYGPCIGTPRLNRWLRAHNLGLNPPIEVLAVLLKEERGNSKVERAHVDELMSNKLGGVEAEGGAWER